MTDYMELTDILMDELPEEHPWKGNVKGLVERLLANGVTTQKWISVKERLPDQYHRVFMAGRNGGVFIGERTSGTTAVSDGHQRGFTHWMELPEAPED